MATMIDPASIDMSKLGQRGDALVMCGMLHFSRASLFKDESFSDMCVRIE